MPRPTTSALRACPLMHADQRGQTNGGIALAPDDGFTSCPFLTGWSCSRFAWSRAPRGLRDSDEEPPEPAASLSAAELQGCPRVGGVRVAGAVSVAWDRRSHGRAWSIRRTCDWRLPHVSPATGRPIEAEQVRRPMSIQSMARPRRAVVLGLRLDVTLTSPDSRSSTWCWSAMRRLPPANATPGSPRVGVAPWIGRGRGMAYRPLKIGMRGDEPSTFWPA